MTSVRPRPAIPRAIAHGPDEIAAERGASAVEYGLLIAGIAAIIVVVIFAFGDNITDLFSDTCQSVVDEQGSGTCS